MCDGVYAEMELVCVDKILELKESLLMEPLILSFDSVDGYPCLRLPRAQAMESMYIVECSRRALAMTHVLCIFAPMLRTRALWMRMATTGCLCTSNYPSTRSRTWPTSKRAQKQDLHSRGA